MMKYKIIIIAISVLAILAGCKKDEIDIYNGNTYIYFDREGEDVQEYSFAFHPGIDLDTVPLIVKLIGYPTDYDREIGLVINESKTTADAADYWLPSEFVLRAGSHIDSIPLVLYKSEKLKESKFTLYLEIKDSEELRSGPVPNCFAQIVFSDMLAKPDWWDEVVVTNFLGKYSDEKYRLFIEDTGIADLTGMSESAMRAYALIFRDFLKKGREEGKEFVDESGDPITVPEGLYT